MPGEVIATGSEYLPGDGTKREDKEIIAIRFGLLDKNDRLIKVIPLSGAYVPRKGNTVIGQVTDVTFNGWILDILSPHSAFLPLAESSFSAKRGDTSMFGIGDVLVTKIKAVKLKAIDLTMKERGLRKLDGGLTMKVNQTRVPRVIGKAGSMVNTIKTETGCSITVGQNGIIWIKGKDVEGELLAKKAIELIVKKPFIDGLTEKIKKFLKDNKK